MFKDQAVRMIRTKWKDAQTLAEELFAIFRSGTLEHEGDARFEVPPGGQFIITGGSNVPGGVGQIGDIRIEEVRDEYQFGPGLNFPPFQPYPYPDNGYPQFGQPSVVIDTPVVITGPLYLSQPPQYIDPPPDQTEPSDPNREEVGDEPTDTPEPGTETPSDDDSSGETPSDSTANQRAYLAKVVSGMGDAHVVDIHADGPDLDATAEGVDVTIMQIDGDEAIPAGTWIWVTAHYREEDEEWVYFAQPPVWLE